MLNRLRFLKGEPEVLVVTYIPEALCPNLIQEDLAHHSLYKLLARKYGLVIASGHQSVEAIALDCADAKQLGSQPKSPALLLKSIGLLTDGKPLEFFIAKHRGDRSVFHIDLVREPKG
jgi:GntR family transcriptional regulator